MNKSRVYIGYNKNQKRCLLYLLDSQYYKDLETDEKYSKDEIYEEFLIPYDQLINIKISSKRNLIDQYLEEENKLIDLSKIFIGNIYQITRIISKEYYGDDLFSYGVKTKFHAELSKENVLLEKDIIGFLDIIRNKRYYKTNLNEGDFFISEDEDNFRPFCKELNLSETRLTKRKILEKYHEKYKIWR